MREFSIHDDDPEKSSFEGINYYFDGPTAQALNAMIDSDLFIGRGYAE